MEVPGGGSGDHRRSHRGQDDRGAEGTPAAHRADERDRRQRGQRGVGRDTGVLGPECGDDAHGQSHQHRDPGVEEDRGHETESDHRQHVPPGGRLQHHRAPHRSGRQDQEYPEQGDHPRPRPELPSEPGEVEAEQPDQHGEDREQASVRLSLTGERSRLVDGVDVELAERDPFGDDQLVGVELDGDVLHQVGRLGLRLGGGGLVDQVVGLEESGHDFARGLTGGQVLAGWIGIQVVDSRRTGTEALLCDRELVGSDAQPELLEEAVDRSLTDHREMEVLPQRRADHVVAGGDRESGDRIAGNGVGGGDLSHHLVEVSQVHGERDGNGLTWRPGLALDLLDVIAGSDDIAVGDLRICRIDPNHHGTGGHLDRPGPGGIGHRLDGLPGRLDGDGDSLGAGVGPGPLGLEIDDPVVVDVEEHHPAQWDRLQRVGGRSLLGCQGRGRLLGGELGVGWGHRVPDRQCLHVVEHRIHLAVDRALDLLVHPLDRLHRLPSLLLQSLRLHGVDHRSLPLGPVLPSSRLPHHQRGVDVARPQRQDTPGCDHRGEEDGETDECGPGHQRLALVLLSKRA